MNGRPWIRIKKQKIGFGIFTDRGLACYRVVLCSARRDTCNVPDDISATAIHPTGVQDRCLGIPADTTIANVKERDALIATFLENSELKKLRQKQLVFDR